MITVDIDMLTPCLKDSETGDLVETEVLKVSRKSFLKKYNEKNGWYTDWSKLADKNEIFALVIKGTTAIQGLVALAPDHEQEAMYVSWMVAAPQNNIDIVDTQQYYGVGGHLFAVAIQRAIHYGFNGAIYGFANSEARLKHYIKWFNAFYIGAFHPYHFLISDNAAVQILEDYNYDWSEDEL